MNYRINLSKQAYKDLKKIKENKLLDKVLGLIEILKVNPYQIPPAYEKLLGEPRGVYSRRINIQHRLVYRIDDKEKIVFVERLWTHYE